MSKNELIELENCFSALKQSLNDEKMLIEILRVFNVPLDISRLKDYRIAKYELQRDLKQLIIEIIDTKTGTAYRIVNSGYSKITGHVSADEGTKFNTIFINSDDMEHNICYYEGETSPSLEEAKIKNSDYSIFLSKSEPFVIRGFDKFDCDYFLIQFCAYGKSIMNLKYTTNYQTQKTKSFKQVAISDRVAHYGINCPNHFCYEESSGNIILGNKFKSPKWYIDGACFEEFSKSAFEGLFYGEFDASPLYQYPILGLTTESFIVYKGYSFLEETSYAHLISITKTIEGIKISYDIKDRDSRNLYPIILDTNFIIPILSEGKVTVDEINMLIVELQTRFPGDDFIAFIISELETFLNRISIRDNLEEEVLSAIDPKVLYGGSFSEVCQTIAANKDYYFNILQELFERETGKKSDSIIRELKPKE